MKKLLVTAIFTMAFTMLLSSFSLAEETLSPSSGLRPFKQTELKDASICKYTYGSQLEGHSGLYDILGNVKGIYIYARPTSTSFKGEKTVVPFLSTDELATLSACTVEKNEGTLPVYIVDANSFLNGIADKSGNLIVNVYVNLQHQTRPDKSRKYSSYFYHDVDPGKLVVVSVSLYRHGVNDFRSLKEAYCSEAFTYTDDKEKFHMLLTDALHQCLDKPFYTIGVPIPSQSEGSR